jgi:hypothetical protein
MTPSNDGATLPRFLLIECIATSEGICIPAVDVALTFAFATVEAVLPAFAGCLTLIVASALAFASTLACIAVSVEVGATTPTEPDKEANRIIWPINVSQLFILQSCGVFVEDSSV